MDTKRFPSPASLVLGLALVSTLISGAVGTARAAGSVIYVRAGAAGANNGTSWVNAYRDLQTALAAAVSGNQIWVAKGTYTPGIARNETFQLKNGVRIYGGFAGTETLLSQRKPSVNVTTLSGEIGNLWSLTDNSYHVVSGSSTDATAVLDGFTITAGWADGAGSPVYDDCGAGIRIMAGGPTLANLIIYGNQATWMGGGMYLSGGSPKLTKVNFIDNSAFNGGGLEMMQSDSALTDVKFTANKATANGGGLDTSNGTPVLTNVTFKGNSGMWGGGMSSDGPGNPTLTRVTFDGNSATSNGGGLSLYESFPALTSVRFIGNKSDIYGGGINNYNSAPKLTNVSFSYNSADFGGAVYSDSPDGIRIPSLSNVLFLGNWAVHQGGAMVNSLTDPVLTNVTFKANEAAAGGAIYNYASNPRLTNVTFSGNTATTSAGAIYNDGSNPTINDAIFWGDGTEVVNSSSTGTLADTILQGGGCPTGATCTHLIKADPKLKPLSSNGGFTKTMALGAGSAAIDAGGAHSTCASKDQRGVTRPQGGKCDIGAYEVRAKIFTSVAAQDGWLLESGETTNLGGSMNSAGSTILLGDDAANKQYRGLLSFNTSTLPDAATVILGKVKVRKAAIVGMDPFTTHGALTLTLKKPYFGTVVGLEVGDFQAAASVASAGTISSTLVSGWYTGLLYSTARAAVNKTGTTQLRLRFTLDDNNDHGADYLSLYSGNVTTYSYRPQLILYYNP